MRNPFIFRNSLEPENRQISQEAEGFSFEESLFGSKDDTRLERGTETKHRLRFLWFLTFVSLCVIFGRLYYLGIAQHSYYFEIAENNRLRIEYLFAPRGAIYDAYQQVLAANKPSFELVISPLDLPKDQTEREQVFSAVAEILGQPVEEIKSTVKGQQEKAYQFLLVKQNLTQKQALIFYEKANELPGFRVITAPIRDYKGGEAFAHLLGYVGKISADEYQEKQAAGYLFNDFLGRTGLEQIYEDFLRGTFGERQVEVDARGAVKKIFGEKESLAGNNLHLNIDASLQEKLYQSLTARLKNLNRQRAVGIIMNPQNGKILALVSLPSFDNNLFAEGIDQKAYQNLLEDKSTPLFNRAISGTYPPGSTVKPMIAAAALEEGVITEKTVINDQGYIVVKNVFGGPDYYFYGYGRRALGLLDVRKAITLSSDIFFYIIGGGYQPLKIEGLGIEKLAEYFHRFGLGQKLGIDLLGEQEGLVPSPAWKKERFKDDPVASRWYLGNTYHVSIGQGDLLVTPLQLLSWISTIANGGKVWRPYLVRQITGENGVILKEFEPQLISELGISPHYLEIVREGMRQVVTAGSARALGNFSVPIAGKTGTAQFDAKNLYRTHAWFAGFAPSENPQIAIVVLVEDGGEGSIAAAPVAGEVLDWWGKNRYQQTSE